MHPTIDQPFRGDPMMIEKTPGRLDRKTALAVTAPGLRARRSRPGKQGFTLVELIIAMVVLGVLVSMGIPRFQQSLEQSRADVGGANLRATWSAQRLYWLENRSYAPDLPTLLAANLIDRSLTTSTTPYAYAVTIPTPGGFTATATRSGSGVWSGTLTIDQDGNFTANILQSGQPSTIAPGFQ
jgi:prepilin-type N-terminal cleavage/methylation domain-containing protein